MLIFMLQTQDKTFKHWLRILEHFSNAAEAARREEEPPIDKHGLLINLSRS